MCSWLGPLNFRPCIPSLRSCHRDSIGCSSGASRCVRIVSSRRFVPTASIPDTSDRRGVGVSSDLTGGSASCQLEHTRRGRQHHHHHRMKLRRQPLVCHSCFFPPLPPSPPKFRQFREITVQYRFPASLCHLQSPEEKCLHTSSSFLFPAS